MRNYSQLNLIFEEKKTFLRSKTALEIIKCVHVTFKSAPHEVNSIRERVNLIFKEASMICRRVNSYRLTASKSRKNVKPSGTVTRPQNLSWYKQGSEHTHTRTEMSVRGSYCRYIRFRPTLRYSPFQSATLLLAARYLTVYVATILSTPPMVSPESPWLLAFPLNQNYAVASLCSRPETGVGRGGGERENS